MIPTLDPTLEAIQEEAKWGKMRQNAKNLSVRTTRRVPTQTGCIKAGLDASSHLKYGTSITWTASPQHFWQLALRQHRASQMYASDAPTTHLGGVRGRALRMRKAFSLQKIGRTKPGAALALAPDCDEEGLQPSRGPQAPHAVQRCETMNMSEPQETICLDQFLKLCQAAATGGPAAVGRRA